MQISIEICCPACGAKSLSVETTIIMGNGTRKRYRKCEACESRRLVRTREIPESTFQVLMKMAEGIS